RFRARHRSALCRATQASRRRRAQPSPLAGSGRFDACFRIHCTRCDSFPSVESPLASARIGEDTKGGAVMAGFQRTDGSPVSDISLTPGTAREVFLWGGGPDNQPLLLRSTQPNVAAIAGQVSAGWPLFKLTIKGVAPGETQIQGTVMSGVEIGKQ